MTWTAKPYTAADGTPLVRLTDTDAVGDVPYSRVLTSDEARALAAELIAAAGVAPAEERSCFTCAHRRPGATCAPFNAEDREDEPVTVYYLTSGADESDDCMPTNRSIPCPGWKAKESP